MQRRNLHQPQQQQLHATHPPSVISKGSATTTLTQQQQQHLPAPTNILQKQPPLYNNNNTIPSQQSVNRSTLSKPHAVPTSLNGVNNSHSRNNGSSSILRTWVLIAIIIVLTFLISLFPEERQMMYDTEQQMEKVVFETEHQFEREVMDYWLSSKQFYTGSDSSDTTTTTTGSTTTSSSYDADIRMQQQSSKWVDDEKKLKKALQVLVERQERGLDLGVPVLTRYLGENIPVFYSKDDTSLNRGINTVEEWNTLIDEKYTEMRNEENRWREIVTSTLLSDRG